MPERGSARWCPPKYRHGGEGAQQRGGIVGHGGHREGFGGSGVRPAPRLSKVVSRRQRSASASELPDPAGRRAGMAGVRPRSARPMLSLPACTWSYFQPPSGAPCQRRNLGVRAQRCAELEKPVVEVEVRMGLEVVQDGTDALSGCRTCRRRTGPGRRHARTPRRGSGRSRARGLSLSTWGCGLSGPPGNWRSAKASTALAMWGWCGGERLLETPRGRWGWASASARLVVAEPRAGNVRCQTPDGEAIPSNIHRPGPSPAAAARPPTGDDPRGDLVSAYCSAKVSGACRRQ